MKDYFFYLAYITIGIALLLLFLIMTSTEFSENCSLKGGKVINSGFSAICVVDGRIVTNL